MITEILHEKGIVDCIVAVITKREFDHPAVHGIRSAFGTVIFVQPYESRNELLIDCGRTRRERCLTGILMLPLD